MACAAPVSLSRALATSLLVSGVTVAPASAEGISESPCSLSGKGNVAARAYQAAHGLCSARKPVQGTRNLPVGVWRHCCSGLCRGHLRVSPTVAHVVVLVSLPAQRIILHQLAHTASRWVLGAGLVGRLCTRLHTAWCSAQADQLNDSVGRAHDVLVLVTSPRSAICPRSACARRQPPGPCVLIQAPQCVFKTSNWWAAYRPVAALKCARTRTPTPWQELAVCGSSGSSSNVTMAAERAGRPTKGCRQVLMCTTSTSRVQHAACCWLLQSC